MGTGWIGVFLAEMLKDKDVEKNMHTGDFLTQPQGHYSENQCYNIGIFQIVPRSCIQKSPVIMGAWILKKPRYLYLYFCFIRGPWC